MELPDILGFELEEALAVIAKSSLQVQDIKTTKPVRENDVNTKARVVRINEGNNAEIRVVVAY